MINQITTQVTILKRKATEVIATLKKHRQPILITEHGQPVAYLVDVKTYEEDQQRLEDALLIIKAEAQIRAGHVYTQEEVEAYFENKFKNMEMKSKNETLKDHSN